MNGFWFILQWTIVGALVVVLVTHAGGVSQVINSFGGFWTGETKILAGGA